MSFSVKHEYAIGDVWQDWWLRRNGNMVMPASVPESQWASIAATFGLPAFEVRYRLSDPASDGTDLCRNQISVPRASKKSTTTYTPASGETMFWGFRVRVHPDTVFGDSFCNMLAHTSFKASAQTGPTYFGKNNTVSQRLAITYGRGLQPGGGWQEIADKPTSYWLDVKYEYKTHPTTGYLRIWVKKATDAAFPTTPIFEKLNIDSYGDSTDLNQITWGIYQSISLGRGSYPCNALQRFAIATTAAEIDAFLSSTSNVFSDDFNRTASAAADFLAAGWSQVHPSDATLNPATNTSTDRMALSTDPDGSKLLRFRTHHTDVAPLTPTTNPRTQLNTGDIMPDGGEFWIAWAQRYPAGSQPNNFILPTDWNLQFQIFGPPYTGSPPWSLGVRPTTNRMIISHYGFDVGTSWVGPVIELGRRYEFLLRYKVAATGGYYELWLDGVKQTFVNGTQRHMFSSLQPGGTAVQMIVANYGNAGSWTGYRAMDYWVPSVKTTQEAAQAVLDALTTPIVWDGGWDGATTIYNVGWDTGQQQWDTRRTPVLTADVPPWTGEDKSLSTSLNVGDFGPGSTATTHRTEMVSAGLASVIGSGTYAFRFQVKLAAGFLTEPPFRLVCQWKNSGTGSPPLELALDDGMWRLDGGFNGGDNPDPADLRVLWWNTAFQRGVWNDFVFLIKFAEGGSVGGSPTPYNGWVSMWHAVGRPVDLTTDQKLNQVPHRTLYTGKTNYIKAGIYRDSSATENDTALHHGWLMGNTLNDVMTAYSPPTQGETPVGRPQVTITADPVPGLIAGDGYQIYRDGTAIAGDATSSPLPSPSYVDSDPTLDWGQTHSYRVSAGQPGRYGPWSDPVAVTLTPPGDTLAPAAPAKPTVVSASTTSIQLSWTPNTEPDLAHYVVQRAVGSGTFTDLDAAVTAASYNDTAVVAGTSYSYRLKAVDASGNVSPAGQAVTVAAEAAPTTPTGLTVVTPAPKQANLSWTAVAGARGYEIYRNGVTIASGITGTTYTDNVAPGDYSYQIAAGIAPTLSAKSAGVAAQVYGINVLPATIEMPAAKEGATSPILYQIPLTGRGTFTVTDDAGWLAVSPTSGSLSDTPTIVTFSADPTGQLTGTYTGTAAFAEAPAPAAPINTSAPTISGTTRSGQTLTGADGTWSGTPTSFTRTWYRNSGASGAWVSVGSGATYALTATDVGYSIRFGVIATNAAGSSAEVFSAATATIEAALSAPTNTALPAISGTAQSGQTLTGSMGSWTGSPTSYAYQWQQETSAGSGTYTNIAGASGTSTGASTTFALTGTQVGLKVRLQVTATNAAGTSSAANSSPTATVTSSAPSLVLARFAAQFDTSGASKITLANGSTSGAEPMAWGALVYLTPVSGRTANYFALGWPSSGSTPARQLTYDPVNDRAGYHDQTVGPRGPAGLAGSKWYWLAGTRNNDTGGRLRCTYVDMVTGVPSADYDNLNTSFGFAPTSAGSIIIGNGSPTGITNGWSGRILAGWRATGFYTLAALRALVSNSGSTFYIDPAVLLAASGTDHVWRLDDPANAIQDLKGSANETARNAITTYDAGSAVLPLKVN